MTVTVWVASSHRNIGSELLGDALYHYTLLGQLHLKHNVIHNVRLAWQAVCL